ncbi:DUF937 domain-containing protein [Microbacterium immunditiarum]|uniref:DUF937 domain-containing protein n=1 Tax=Microbacterium immunditiarum TaxID=337480 RepID=A0A7Y9GLK6_9MICO|nr:DUF937 domain-containing protein [Microbacterium immunditiarum]NYE18748.1 hypothetical protein [Microbacterium immunditiarum]
MAGLDDILKMIPIDQLASKLGVDPDTAAQAVEQGGGAILTGLQKNAQSPDGAAALQKALGQHQGLGDSVDVDRVDTEDGEKILKHVFGEKEQAVKQTLTEAPQTAGIDFGKLLPMLAPIVMGLLAKKQQPAGGAQAQESSGGGIGDLIGGLLGGGGGQQQGGGLDIGGLLGGLFGGNK